MNILNKLSIDVIILLFYVSLCLIIGFYKALRIRNIREYTLADRNFPIFFLAATIFATSISASSGIDKVGIIYEYGIIYAIPSILLFIYWIITSKIFASRIYKFSDCISLSEVMERFYGKPGLCATNFSVILDSIGFISIQITGIGFLFKYFFGISYEYGVTFGFIVFTTYSLFGGVRAVIITDVMQFLIFFIAFPMGCGILYNEIGGYKIIVNQLDSSYFQLNHEKFWQFLSYLFYCLMPTVAAPNIQRMLIAKDKKELSKVFILVAFMALAFNITLVLISITLKIKNPLINSKEVLYFFVHNYLPVGITGCMIVGMLAIMMSTADSWLNVASSTLAHDVVKKIFKNISEKKELYIARIATVIIGLLSYYIALKFKKISDLIWSIRSFVQPVIFVPFLSGLFGFKAKKYTFVVSGVIGVISVIIVKITTNSTGLLGLMIGTISSAIGFFGFHYFNRIIELKSIFKKYYIEKHLFTKYLTIFVLKYCKLRNTFYQKNQFYVSLFLGGYILTNIPITAVMFKNYNFNENILIYIRCLFTMMCVLFYAINHLKHYKYKELFFYLVISIILPFYSILGALISSDKIPWMLSFLMSVFILYWFSKRYLEFIISLLITVTIACAVSKYCIIDNNYSGYYHLCSLSLFLLLSVYFDKKEKNLHIELTKKVSRTVAHDLKNPISIIKTHLYSLKKRNSNQLELVEFLNKIEMQANKSMALIENSMSALREQYKLDLEDLYIGEIINNSIKDFDNYRLPSINIIVDISINFRVRADKILLIRTVTNILNNACDALKYSKNKSIKITADIIENYPTLSIKDTGIGIKKESLSKIFEPSFSEKSKGTGFGLAFCKAALEIMNIEIKCNSIYSEYTEILIIFH